MRGAGPCCPHPAHPPTLCRAAVAAVAGTKKVAVAYSIMQFQKQPEDMDIRSYLWDLNNSSKPELELQPASQLCCMQFNSKVGSRTGSPARSQGLHLTPVCSPPPSLLG